MSTLEHLVQLLAGQYRWGLHPVKLLAALLAPVVIVWLADWRLRALMKRMQDDAKGDQGVRLLDHFQGV